MSSLISLKQIYSQMKIVIELGVESKVSLSFDKFLQVLCNLNTLNKEEITVLISIASLFKEAAFQYPYLADILLHHITSLPYPGPFIECFPSLFAYSSPEHIRKVIDILLSLYESDNTLQLSIITAWIDLPKTMNSETQLHDLVVEALNSNSECEVPFLMRTLLKSFEGNGSLDIIQEALLQVSAMSENTITLVIEAVWEAASMSPHIQSAISNYILKRNISTKNSAKSSLFDTAILLTLVGTANYKGKQLDDVIAHALFRPDAQFPIDDISYIIKSRRYNEVWERLIPVIWSLSTYLMDIVSRSTETNIGSRIQNSRYINRVMEEQLICLISCLFESVPCMRELITCGLLSRCFAVSRPRYYHHSIMSGADADVSIPFSIHPNDGRKAEGNHRSYYMNKFVSQPKLNPYIVDMLSNSTEVQNHRTSYSIEQANTYPFQSKASERFTSLHKYSSREEYSLHHRAIFSSKVIQKLLQSRSVHDQVAPAVLTAFTNQLQPNSSGLLVLPSLAILHRLLAGLAEASAKSAQLENTLLILTQKLLATYEDKRQNHVTASYKNGELSRKGPQCNISTSDVEQKYSPLQLGFLLACHLYHRHLHSSLQSQSEISASSVTSSSKDISATDPLGPLDVRGLLGWVRKALSLIQGPSLVACLDFSWCLMRLIPGEVCSNGETVTNSVSSTTLTSRSSKATVLSGSYGRPLQINMDSYVVVKSSLDSFFNSFGHICSRNASSLSHRGVQSHTRKSIRAGMSTVKVPLTVGSHNLSSTQETVWHVAHLVDMVIMQPLEVDESDFECTLSTASDWLWATRNVAYIASLLQNRIAIDTSHLRDGSPSNDMMKDICFIELSMREHLKTNEVFSSRQWAGRTRLSSRRLKVGRGDSATSMGFCEDEEHEVEHKTSNPSSDLDVCKLLHGMLWRWPFAASSAYDTIHDWLPEDCPNVPPGAEPIRLAWEHAYTASVLLGQLRSRVVDTAAVTDWEALDESTLFTDKIQSDVVRFLCQISSVRHYLQIASRHVNVVIDNTSRDKISNHTKHRSKNYAGHNRMILGTGNKRASHTQFHGHNDDVHEANMVKMTNMRVMLYQLNRLITRMMRDLPVPVILATFRDLQEQRSISALNSPEQVPLVPRTRATPLTSRSSEGLRTPSSAPGALGPLMYSTNDDHFLSKILSDSGYMVIESLLTQWMKIAGLEDSHSLQSPECNEFFSFEDILSNSSETALLQGIESEVLRVISLLPAIMTRSEHLRKSHISSDVNNFESDKNLGSSLNRHGCVTLCLLSFLNVDRYLSVLQAQTDIEGYLKHSFLNEFGTLLSRHNSNQLETSASLSQENEYCILCIYKAIEAPLLCIQDVSLAIGSLKFLIALTIDGRTLKHRLAALAWTLATSIMTELSVTDIPISADTNIGYGSFIYQLQLYVTTIPKIEDCYVSSLEAKNRTKRNALKLLRDSLFFKRSNSKKLKHLNLNQKDSQIFSQIKLLWGLWWCLEDVNQRVYGIALVLRQIFQVHLKAKEVVSRGDFPPSTEIAEEIQRNKGKQSVSKEKWLGKHRGTVTAAASALSTPDGSSVGTSKSSSMKCNHRTQLHKRRRVVMDSDNDFSLDDHSSSDNDITKSISLKMRSRTNVYGQSVGVGNCHSNGHLPGVTLINAQKYFTLLLSILPSVILTQKPRCPTETSPSKHELYSSSTALSPYKGFIRCCQLVIWIVMEVQSLLEGGLHLPFILQVSSMLIKSFRSILDVMDIAIDKAATWRSKQSIVAADSVDLLQTCVHNTQENGNKKRVAPTSPRGRSVSSNSTTPSQSLGKGIHNKSIDYGSLDFFEDLLCWTLTTCQGIKHMSELLQSHMVDSYFKLEIPKKLRASLNVLQKSSVKSIDKIEKWAVQHSLSIAVIEDVDFNVKRTATSMPAWERHLWREAFAFQSRHSTCLSKAVTIADWTYNERSDEDAFGMDEGEVSGEEGSQPKESGFPIEAHNCNADNSSLPKFAVVSKSSKGWGLYEDDGVSESSGNDDDSTETECDDPNENVSHANMPSTANNENIVIDINSNSALGESDDDFDDGRASVSIGSSVHWDEDSRSESD